MDEQKRRAALRSLEFVKPGMILGLGSGSTAAIMIELLGAKVRAGLDVHGVPTSEATRRLAVSNAIPMTGFDQHDRLDLTIDGADEIDRYLNLVKGGGGHLLREKIVASFSEQVIIIADSSKVVRQLGRCPLPVEVIPFSLAAMVPRLAAFGCVPRIRREPSGRTFVTDEGNNIVDCDFDGIDNPRTLSHALDALPGVVAHGLFIGLADRAFIGSDYGVNEYRAG